MPWSTTGVLVCMKEDQVEVQKWPNHTGLNVIEGNYLKLGEEQEITFGVYDYDAEANQVKIVLSIDGNELYNEVVTDAKLTDFEGYFITCASKDVKVTLGETKVVEPVLYEGFSEQDQNSPIQYDAGSGSYNGEISTEQCREEGNSSFKLKTGNSVVRSLGTTEFAGKELTLLVWDNGASKGLDAEAGKLDCAMYIDDQLVYTAEAINAPTGFQFGAIQGSVYIDDFIICDSAADAE